MIVNIRIEVTDEQRNRVARMLDGKDVKRLATRNEYNALVADFVSKLGEGARTPAKREPAPVQEAARPHPMDAAPPAPPEDAPVPACFTTDRTPVSIALEAVNNAVFALQVAKRFHPADQSVQQCVLLLADARDAAVDAFERLS